MAQLYLVSAWPPIKPDAMEGGSYRRLTIMIEAIRENCSKIHALFMGYEDDYPENELLQTTERRIQEWGME